MYGFMTNFQAKILLTYILFVDDVDKYSYLILIFYTQLYGF